MANICILYPEEPIVCSQTCGLDCNLFPSLQAAWNVPLLDLKMKSVNTFLWNSRRFGITPKHLLERAFPPNAPRILLISIPKAGTHLLERVLCLHPLIYRSVLPTIIQPNVVKFGGFDTILSRLKNGQLAVTHLPFSIKEMHSINNNQIRHIFIYRDPRDVVLSTLNHLVKEKKHPLHKSFITKSKDEQLKLIIDGDYSMGFKPIFDKYRERSDWLSSQGLSVAYESLIGSKGGGSNERQNAVIKDIFSYLKIPTSSEFIAEVSQKAFSSSSPTFNVGKIARWKKELSQESQDYMMDKGHDIFQKYGYA
jgi:sulfotransferase 6B1